MAKKKQAAPPTGASPAPAPQVVNAAPGYAAPPPQPAPPAFAGGGYGNPYGQPAPGGPVPGFTASAAPVVFGAPPPKAAQNPFVNAMFVYNFGRPFRATITGVRDATGTGNPQFNRPGLPPKRGWYFDIQIENGTLATMRVNEGTVVHERLFAAFGSQPVGKSVLIRLSNPADKSKSAWTLDAA